MVGVSMHVTIDEDVLADIEDFIDEMPGPMIEAGQRVANEVGPTIVAELQFEPGPVQYPIAWTSEKQRKAYFATDGFGAGIPYRRTGALLAGWHWRVDFTPEGGLFEVYNESGVYPFVMGDPERPGWQQRFHRRTGWLDAKMVQQTLDYWSEAASEMVYEAFLEIWAASVYGG